MGVGHRVLRCLESVVPSIEVEAVLRLELGVEEDLELPVVWMISTVFSAIWKLRADKSRVQLYEIRAQLEAKVNLLRETRFTTSATILDEFVVNFIY